MECCISWQNHHLIRLKPALQVLTSEDLDVVANLARETGAYVLSDEIYARRQRMGVDGDNNLV